MQEIYRAFNKSEVFSDLIFKASMDGAFIAILIIVLGAGLIAFYIRHQKHIYKQLRSKEKELWHSEERFKITLDSIGDGVITANLDGRIEYLNKAAEKLTGWSADIAHGRMLDEVYSIKNEITQKKETHLIDKVLKLGMLKELANHTILISKDGTEIPVSDTGAPIREKKGSVIGIAIVFSDETEKRRQRQLLAASEARLKSTLDNMMDGCQIISRDWRYLYINDSALKHGKADRDKILNRTMMEVYPGIEKTEMFRILNLCMHDRIFKLYENEFEFPDGSSGWFELSIQPVSEGLFILSHDITYKKEAELAITRSKEKAEEMNRIKSYFFANMGHELRTPLVGILGFGEIIAEKYNDDKELSEMTGYIKKSGERLLETLNKILHVSKIESEKVQVNMKPVNLVSVAKEMAVLFSSAASWKNLTLDINADSNDIISRTDPYLLKIVLNNLLSNAIKFTESGGVNIKIETTGDINIISVSDTGRGIMKEMQGMIWEEFRQASEGFERKYEGMGLGLTIAKKYTELIGGRIYVDSVPEKGAEFIVELPALRMDFNPTADEADYSLNKDFRNSEVVVAVKERKKLLYVEDDSMSQRFVSLILKKLHNLDAAKNSHEALKKLKEKKYDLILMDINLGNGMDGKELTGIIRKLPAYELMPIIAVTAYALDEHKVDFLTNGFTDYISKPFSKQKLIAAIEENLGG